MGENSRTELAAFKSASITAGTVRRLAIYFTSLSLCFCVVKLR